MEKKSAGSWSHPQILMKSDICRLRPEMHLPVFSRKEIFPLAAVKDVRGSLKRLEIGSSLGIGELLAICSLLENTNRVKAYSRSERGDSLPDSLDGMFEALEPLTPLTTEIRRCILSEDEISMMQAATSARFEET